MNGETPGETIRRARQVARLTQARLAAELGVHKNTVADWEKGKYFPDRHYAALNKILGISLRAPGSADEGGPAERGPDSTIDADVLAALRRAYRGEPDKLAEAIRAIEEVEAGEQLGDERSSSGEGRSRRGRRAG